MELALLVGAVFMLPAAGIRFARSGPYDRSVVLALTLDNISATINNSDFMNHWLPPPGGGKDSDEGGSCVTVVTESVLEDWIAVGRQLRAIQAVKSGDSWFSLDLTMAQLKVALLVAQTAGISSRSIADRLNIGPSAVTPLVDSLVKLKFARREGDPTDRRVVHIEPTPKLLELHASLLQSSRTLLAEILEEMPKADRDVVARALSVLRESTTRVYERMQEEMVAK